MKKFRYPKVNCELIAEEYGENRALWETDAGNEYITNFAKQEAGKQTFYTGQMQCLCLEIQGESDKITAREKEFAINVKGQDADGNPTSEVQ